ncbi:MAG: DUF4269 domain-containing protein [Cyclobacteriaceae bacterium]
MPVAFYDPASLSRGTPDQKKAVQCLDQLQTWRILAPFHPTLCGTLPLQISIAGSDLDVICQFENADAFAALLLQYYGHLPDFSLTTDCKDGTLLVFARFSTPDFPVEIFGQNISVERQHAFRHMIQEERLLRLADEAFRQEIIRLKESGMSTEAAFSHLLQLAGDPFTAILELEDTSEPGLRQLIADRRKLSG